MAKSLFRWRLVGAVSLLALGHSVQAQEAKSAVPANDAEPSSADPSNPTSSTEIIVTAQRREENLQHVALAVDAVGGQALIDAGVHDIAGLSNLVPSLVVQPATGSSVGFYLRGIGALVGNAFTENPVAFNFNQAYIARPASLQGTLYDLQRVEVLKGPQGTLYGRNATGGAINVIPNRPVFGKRGLKGTIEVGNYNLIRTEAAVNLPLGENFAVRVAGMAVSRDGYLSDGYDDDVGQAMRGSLAFKSGILSAVLVADYYHQGGKGTGSVVVPSPLIPNAPNPSARIGAADPIADAAILAAVQASALAPIAKTNGPLPGIIRPRQDGYFNNNFWGISANINFDLDFATLSLVPAYRNSKPNYLTYNGGYYGRVTEKADQYSLEARLASNGDGPFQYVIGGYYFNEGLLAGNQFVQGSVLNTDFVSDLDTRSVAAFGQATYELFSGFRLLAGARYTHERKTNVTGLRQTGFFAGNPVDPFNNTVPRVQVGGEQTFNKVTYKAGIEWDVTPSNLIYANVATGFKSGGFFVATLDNTFRPETITAYTLGSKNRFLDNRLTLNVEAFYWKYKDQQVNYIGPTRNLNAAGMPIVGAGLVTANAGTSEIYGAEAELVFRPTRADVFSANVQYLHGQYKNFQYLASGNVPPRTNCTSTPTVDPRFPVALPTRTFLIDCSGRTQINSPKWSAVLDYEHTFAVGSDTDLRLGARTKIESSRYLSIEFLPEERQGGYMTSDLYAKLEMPHWSLTAYVNNIENTTIYSGTSLRPVFPIVFNILRAPRTYGLRLGFDF